MQKFVDHGQKQRTHEEAMRDKALADRDKQRKHEDRRDERDAQSSFRKDQLLSLAMQHLAQRGRQEPVAPPQAAPPAAPPAQAVQPTPVTTSTQTTQVEPPEAQAEEPPPEEPWVTLGVPKTIYENALRSQEQQGADKSMLQAYFLAKKRQLYHMKLDPKKLPAWADINDFQDFFRKTVSSPPQRRSQVDPTTDAQYTAGRVVTVEGGDRNVKAKIIRDMGSGSYRVVFLDGPQKGQGATITSHFFKRGYQDAFYRDPDAESAT